jgi:hypothetical protein
MIDGRQANRRRIEVTGAVDHVRSELTVQLTLPCNRCVTPGYRSPLVERIGWCPY